MKFVYEKIYYIAHSYFADYSLIEIVSLKVMYERKVRLINN